MATQLKWYEATDGTEFLFHVLAQDEDEALERAMEKCIDLGLGYTPGLAVHPTDAPAVVRLRRPGDINFGS